jgi:3'-phosphoadenosine 5'-phosphosulfate sulfotransferase (PAPS reductase)/FAD synthetase
MSEIKLYLSHGMGVNSTALMLMLEDFGIKYEAVFVDTGCEHPETYEYLNYLREQGYEITVLKPDVGGFDNLYGYCKHYRIVPGQFTRWCTYKFKIKTLKNYIESPAVMFVGIAYDEKHRAFTKPVKNGVINAYPLVNYRVTREECIKIIKEHGLKIPRKSGCWLCPFAKKEEVRELYLKHRELYEKRKEIERLASERAEREIYLNWKKKTEELAHEDVIDITVFLEG